MDLATTRPYAHLLRPETRLRALIRITVRWLLSLASLCTAIGLGLATHAYVGPFARFVTQNLNSVFYCMAWVFALALLAPLVRPGRIVLVAIAACFGVEWLQLWHPHFLEVLRAEPLGRMLLGSAFNWSDLLCYALGGWIAGLWLGELPRATYQEPTHPRPYGVPASPNPPLDRRARSAQLTNVHETCTSSSRDLPKSFIGSP